MAEESRSESACSCSGAGVVILACSGASNTGHLSDLAVRELTRRGVGRMGCLAGLVNRNPGTVTALQQASAIVAVDGCSVQCAQRILAEAGYKHALCLQVDAFGMKRGETPVNEENVRRLADSICQKIAESLDSSLPGPSPRCG